MVLSSAPIDHERHCRRGPHCDTIESHRCGRFYAKCHISASTVPPGEEYGVSPMLRHLSHASIGRQDEVIIDVLSNDTIKN